MLFNQLYFFIFLGVVLCLHALLNDRQRNALLLISSYFFYGWWNWHFTFLLFYSTIIDYFCGLYLGKTSSESSRKKILILSLMSNLGVLGFFKYFNFFILSFADLANFLGLNPSLSTLNIILPVGISFYTFQTMSYTIDIYRRRLDPCHNFIDYALFVSFFPQLVAGPIERAVNLLPQVVKPRTIDKKAIRTGFFLVVLGYFKKVIVSDNIAPIVDSIFTGYASLGSMQLVIGLVLFSIQIYFDFSGYSDIARGIARLFGFEIMVNFRQPYFAKNVREFWHRWHISLSTWLRDYLYIPLGGNRKGAARTYANLMITMVLGGLWHGASWNFVLWGTLHGLYLSVYRFLSTRIDNVRIEISLLEFLGNGIAIIFTYSIVLISWLPFRANNLGTTISYLKGILFWQGGVDVNQIMILLLALGTIMCVDLPYELELVEKIEKFPSWMLYGACSAIMIIVSFSMLLNINSERPFIYFQF